MAGLRAKKFKKKVKEGAMRGLAHAVGAGPLYEAGQKVKKDLAGAGKPKPKKETREELLQRGKRDMDRIQERLDLEDQFDIKRGK